MNKNATTQNAQMKNAVKFSTDANYDVAFFFSRRVLGRSPNEAFVSDEETNALLAYITQLWRVLLFVDTNSLLVKMTQMITDTEIMEVNLQ